MKIILCLLLLIVLTACTTNDDTNNASGDGSGLSNDAPKVINRINYADFLDAHNEAEFTNSDDIVNPENIAFEVIVEGDTETGISDNQIELYVEVEEGEELVLGSTHYVIEYYNDEEWEAIDNVPYGQEDAEVRVTSDQPLTHTFTNIDQYDTDFNNGIYRIINSGYVFPFYVYVLE